MFYVPIRRVREATAQPAQEAYSSKLDLERADEGSRYGGKEETGVPGEKRRACPAGVELRCI